VDAPTDESLLKEYLHGKQGSFELLVRRHSRELHQFVMRFTGDSVAAEDIVQDSFLQVHHSAQSFDPGRRFKPWLFTIAANKARDALRRRTRRREVPFDATIPGGDGESTSRFLDLLATEDAESPDEELQADENRQVVQQIIESMPEHLSEVLILGYYHRFPYKDIAEIIGVPLGTVKSRLHAAVVAFGERYREATTGKTKNHDIE
jgi:RNA polymerase sigma-70 factor (ECF subfamily)